MTEAKGTRAALSIGSERLKTDELRRLHCGVNGRPFFKRPPRQSMQRLRKVRVSAEEADGRVRELLSTSLGVVSRVEFGRYIYIFETSLSFSFLI